MNNATIHKVKQDIDNRIISFWICLPQGIIMYIIILVYKTRAVLLLVSVAPLVVQNVIQLEILSRYKFAVHFIYITINVIQCRLGFKLFFLAFFFFKLNLH